MNTTRRDFIMKSVLATAGISSGIQSLASSIDLSATPEEIKGALSVNIFSKNLHWLNYADMATVVADLGFDGIDLTVRPEGHVLPERVADDLPKAVEAVKKAGLNVYMITTAISKADDPFIESILKAASASGVSYYRMGWMNYEYKKSIDENLKEFKAQMTKLAALNKKYKICGDYQNHSGTSFGSAVWDLGMILQDLDAQWIGSQYDVLHAYVEGSNSWPIGMKLLKSHIHTLDIKDCQWVKKDGAWKSEVVPLGEGAIDFKKYFSLLKEYNLRGPFSMHFEYPLGGAENGAKILTMKKEDVLAAMKKDLALFRKWLSEPGLK